MELLLENTEEGICLIKLINEETKKLNCADKRKKFLLSSLLLTNLNIFYHKFYCIMFTEKNFVAFPSLIKLNNILINCVIRKILKNT